MKVVITGSEGLIGKQLVKDLSIKYEILKLDLKLGHDLNDEKFISDFFKKNKPIYGLIICHGLNPQKNAKFDNNPLTLKTNSINQYFENNLLSPFNLCRYFIKNNKKGKIQIAFPTANTDWETDGVSHLLCQLMGGHVDIDIIFSCRLKALELPMLVKKYLLKLLTD